MTIGNKEALKRQCTKLERRRDNLNHRFLTKPVMDHEELLSPRAVAMWNSGEINRAVRQSLLKKYLISLYPSPSNSVIFNQLIRYTDEDLDKMLTANNGVPNAVAKLGLPYYQVPLSIPNEESQLKSPILKSTSDTEISDTQEASHDPIDKNEARAEASKPKSTKSKSSAQKKPPSSKTKPTSLSADNVSEANNTAKSSNDDTSTILPGLAAGVPKQATVLNSPMPPPPPVPPQEYRTDISEHSPSHFSTVKFTRDMLENFTDSALKGKMSENIKPFILQYYPDELDAVFHSFMSASSAKQISCFVDAGAFKTWAEKNKFKTAAEKEADANALAKSSPNKYGKGLNSRFHESTYTIQCRHKVGARRDDENAVTLARKFLIALSAASTELNHTLRLISSKIEESLNPMTTFDDGEALERFLTNVDISPGYIDFTLCVISSLNISQLRNIGLSGCKAQSKRFRQMLFETHMTMTLERNKILWTHLRLGLRQKRGTRINTRLCAKGITSIPARNTETTSAAAAHAYHSKLRSKTAICKRRVR